MIRSLVREIHRRSLWQVLGIYLAVSWLVLQVVDVIGNNFGLPAWVPPAALVLLLLGLPIVIATAFVQEGWTGGPGGERSPEPPEPGEPAPARAGTDAAPRGPVRDDHPGRHGLFTWRNALLGGGAAFALLGLATAGYMAMRVLGIGPAGTLVAAGVLDERDPILVAELESPSGDTVLARTATEALRADIATSPTVTLLSADQIGDGLERMRRDPRSRLDVGLARELATREGIKAIIAGEVNAAGGGYLLTARVLSATDGSVLVSRRESAASEDEVIGAIDRLSKGVRERLGESLRSLQSAPPLARVTTGSLEALQKFQEGDRALGRGDREGGLELLYEAVAIDTAFAAAWRRIATELGNPGHPAEVRIRELEAATRGYVHRDRLTEYERARAEAIYHRSVTGDRDRELAVYERGVERWPESGAMLNNLAVQLIEVEEFERAEAMARRGLALEDPGSAFFLRINLIRSLLRQGRLDEADSLRAVFGPDFPGHPFFYLVAPLASRLSRADWEGMEAVVDSAGLWGERIAMLRGRAEEARAALERRLAELDRAGAAADYLETAVRLVAFDARVRRDPVAAGRTLDGALARHPLESIDAVNRPYGKLVEALALLGRVERARVLLREYEAEVIEPVGVVWDRDWHRARAELALAEGRDADAVAEQRIAEASPCRTRCPELARVYDLAGEPDSALALYARYVEHAAGVQHLENDVDVLHLAPALERLGQLHDERGDLESAATYYARFVDLWAEADAELQPRVRVAQDRLEEIVRARG